MSMALAADRAGGFRQVPSLAKTSLIVLTCPSGFAYPDGASAIPDWGRRLGARGAQAKRQAKPQRRDRADQAMAAGVHHLMSDAT
jgi:hypothetical protein